MHTDAEGPPLLDALVEQLGDGPVRPAARERERVKVGDRLAAFTALLPAEPVGPVVVVVGPGLAGQLVRRFGSVTVLDSAGSKPDSWTALSGGTPPAVLRWDGRRPPIQPGGAGLLIVDERLVDPGVLSGVLAPEGTLAVLSRRGRWAVYPDVDRPELVWRRGWPPPAMPTMRRQLRRSAGLRLRRGATRLDVRGPTGAALTDRVLTDLRQATGRTGRLVGLHSAGWTVLRVRCDEDDVGDLAVRMSITDPGREPDQARAVATDVPAVAHLIQLPVARGRTCGVPWVATRWLPSHRRSPAEVRATPAAQAAVADELVAGLEAVPTGQTGHDWAAQWLAPVTAILPAPARVGLLGLLRPLEVGLPTGWAHGDVWADNILLDRGGAAVIDWDNADRDAPLGLDRILVHAFRARAAEGIGVAMACARLVERPDGFAYQVAGRPWTEWSRPERAALATAAYVLHLRNRAIYDLDLAVLAADLEVVLALAEPPAGGPVVHGPMPDGPIADELTADRPPADRAPADDGDDEGSGHTGGAGHVARGALWLGASSLVVKGLQTLVLLVLAATLAPSALGLVAIGTMVVNISTAVSDLGTSSALVYWRGDARRAARSAVTVALALSLALTAVAWALAPWLVSALRVDPSGVGVIRGLTSVLPCYAVASVSQELLRRALKFARRIVPDVISTVAGTTVSIVLAVQGHGVAALVVGQILQGVLALVITWAVGEVVVPGWRRDQVRALLAYGGHLSGSNLAQLVLLNIDYLIVSRVLGGTALGEYSLAFRLAYLPFLNIAVVTTGAAFPYLCRLRGEWFDRAFERISAATVLVMLPVCLGIALVADQLTLLGNKWAPAVVAVRWLMLYAFALGLVQLVQTALMAVGRPREAFVLRLLHLLLLAGALVALTRHGIAAVGIAQVLAVVLVCAAAVPMCRRHLAGVALRRVVAEFRGAALGTVAMAAVVLLLDRVLPGAQVSAVRLVVLAVAGAIAYVAPVWFLDRVRLAETVALVRGRR